MIICNLKEIEVWKSQWIDLWQQDPYSTPFNHPDWILSYANAFPFDHYFIIGEDENRLNCLWSLQKINHVLYFTGDPQADYSRPSISKYIDEKKAVDILFEGLSKISFTQVVLREFFQDDPLIKILNEHYKKFSYYGLLEKGFPCPRMVQEQDNHLFHKKFVKSKNQKRVLSLLKRNGELEYLRFQSRSEIIDQLSTFFLMHTSRWDSVGETVFMDHSMRQFYLNLTKTLPANLIHFTVLKQADRPIAMNYDFAHHNTLYWYKAAFDNQLQNQSPGLGLLCYIGRDINEKKWDTLDFTRGTESWKMRFANQVNYTTNIILSRSRFSILKYHVKTRLKSTILSKIKNKEQLKNQLTLFKIAIQKYGYRGLVQHQLQKLISTHFQNPRMYIFEKNIECRHIADSSDRLTFIKGNYSHLFAIADLLNPIKKVQYLKNLISRLSQGDMVYLGYIEEKLVYSMWLATKKESVYVEEVDNYLPLKKNAAYIYDVFTASRYRGRGIHRRGIEFALEQVRLQYNCSHAVAVVLTSNKPSIRGFEKSNFKRVGLITSKTVQQ